MKKYALLVVWFPLFVWNTFNVARFLLEWNLDSLLISLVLLLVSIYCLADAFVIKQEETKLERKVKKLRGEKTSLENVENPIDK